MAAVASGMTMRLLPKTTYDFQNLASGTSQTIMICQHIDASVFQEVDVAVRVHSGTITTNGSTIAVNVLADGWTLEDPGLALVGTTALASVTYPFAIAPPIYSLLSVATGAGRLLSVSIVGHQASTTACNVTISIDMTMKSGDPSALPLDYNTYRGYRI